MISENFTFEDESLPISVVVTDTRWDEPPRIRHQIVRQLIRFSNVLFVELFLTDETHGSAVEKISDRLVVWRPGRQTDLAQQMVARVPLVMPWIYRRFASLLEGELAKLSGSAKLLFNFIHTNFPLMHVKGFDDRTYVCFDEFPKMWRQATHPHPAKFFFRSLLFQFYENRLAQRADRCLAVHKPLLDKLLKVNPNTLLFLQATELMPSSYVQLPLSKKRNLIKVGYMGYLTYNQKMSWLARVALEPDMELVLIGPRDRKFDVDDLLSGGQVSYTGPLNGDALFSKMAEMDVLVMAYDPTIPEVAVQTASNKFFQYLAAGKPVVISDMRHYLEMPEGVVYKADCEHSFVAQVRHASQSDCNEFIAVRQAIAAENTWDKRGEELHAYLKEALGDRIPNLDG